MDHISISSLYIVFQSLHVIFFFNLCVFGCLFSLDFTNCYDSIS